MTDHTGYQLPRETANPGGVDPTDRAAFDIHATATAARSRHTLKHADTFVVLDSFGDIGASAGGPDGVFDHDTRYLSRFEMLLAEAQPLLLGSGVRDNNLTFTADLTNPDVYRDGRIVMAKDTVHVVRTTYLWGGAAHQRIHVSNHGPDRVEFTLTFVFGCDFSDLFEARGMRRENRGTTAEAVAGDEVAFTYTGLDHVSRRAVLRFAPAPRLLLAGAATFDVALDPGAARTVTVSAACSGVRPSA